MKRATPSRCPDDVIFDGVMTIFLIRASIVRQVISPTIVVSQTIRDGIRARGRIFLRRARRAFSSCSPQPSPPPRPRILVAEARDPSVSRPTRTLSISSMVSWNVWFRWKLETAANFPSCFRAAAMEGEIDYRLTGGKSS